MCDDDDKGATDVKKKIDLKKKLEGFGCSNIWVEK
jgi:hypothetical protein